MINSIDRSRAQEIRHGAPWPSRRSDNAFQDYRNGTACQGGGLVYPTRRSRSIGGDGGHGFEQIGDVTDLNAIAVEAVYWACFAHTNQFSFCPVAKQ